MVRKRGAVDLPKCLYLEVTNRCNLKCKGCIIYKGGWEPERDMSFAEVKMIAAQLPGLERAVLHGIGEPLLNRELTAMVCHLKKRKVTVLFNSNGLLLNEKKQEELIGSHLDELRISLDAASESGYKAMRESNKFSLIVHNLRGFAERLKSRNSPKPKLSLWFMGTTENVSELPALIELAAQIGIGEVYLQRLVYFLDNRGYGLARSEMTLTNPDATVQRFIQRSEERAQQLGISLSASGLTDPLHSVQGKTRQRAPWKNCVRPWELIYITSHGNVLPCCISPFSTADYSSIILGNIFEQPLDAIWFGAKYQAFRSRHQTLSPPNCCQGCGIHWSL